MVFCLVIFTSWKFIKNYKLKFSNTSYFIISIISMSGMLGIISGVRQNWAWAFFMIAIYYDFYSNKKNKILQFLLYIIPLSIHLSSLPIILIRIIFAFIKNNKKVRFFFLFWPFIIIGLEMINDYLPNFFQITLDQFGTYNNFELIITPLILIKLLVNIILIVLVFKLERTPEKWNVIETEFLNFYIILLLYGFSRTFKNMKIKPLENILSKLTSINEVILVARDLYLFLQTLFI